MPHGGEALLSEAQVADEPRERALVELIETALRANASIRLRADGGSMIPAIWPGDVLTIIPAQIRYPEVDEVALVRIGRTVRVHRVIQRREDGGLRIQGDALRQSDPYIERGAVLGTAIARNGRALAPGRLRWGAVAAVRRMAYSGLLPLRLAVFHLYKRGRRNGRA